MIAVIALGKAPAGEQSALGETLAADVRPPGAAPRITAEPPASADRRSIERRVSRAASAAGVECCLVSIGAPTQGPRGDHPLSVAGQWPIGRSLAGRRATGQRRPWLLR